MQVAKSCMQLYQEPVDQVCLFYQKASIGCQNNCVLSISQAQRNVCITQQHPTSTPYAMLVLLLLLLLLLLPHRPPITTLTLCLSRTAAGACHTCAVQQRSPPSPSPL
jgi:hypothetical protein